MSHRSVEKIATRVVALALLVLLFVYGYRTQIATVKPEAPLPAAHPVTSFDLDAGH